ncbi:MAG TPA: zinc-binding dehydrogenase [Thermoleophilaceae bacterium]|jgi:NADPH2:quinone reductase|nr:zinc-binding dehydrogenase [Thermoleophilaceae bacterium]
MRAAVLEEIGKPPVAREFDEPQRGRGQSLIEVTAAPLNPVDLWISSGKHHAGAPPVPSVVGREAVGRVIESDTIESGTRVYAPVGAGGMAERLVAPDDELVELPEGVEDPLAASFGVAGLAAWLGLTYRGNLQHGETVLVLGATGAVGSIAVQGAKLLGAGWVVAAGRSEEGLKRAEQLGADATVRLDAGPDLADAIVDACDGRLDLTIDPLWGEPAAAAVLASSFQARLVQIGQSASPEATLPSGAVRGKALSILGHTSPGVPVEVRRDAYSQMLRHAAAGELTVDYELLPLDQVAQAWERQAASPGRKLVLAPGDVP